MNEYAYFMILAIGMAGGLVCGMLSGIWVMAVEKVPRRHEKRKKIGKMETPGIIKKIRHDTKPDEGVLKRRIAPEKSSWTEINCNADMIDEKEYINQSRKKEDRAYRYAKRRAGK